MFSLIVLPLLLILMVISIDLATFFSVREQVRVLLDEVAQEALSRRLTTAQLERSIKQKIGELGHFLQQPVIETRLTRDASILSFQADYHPVLADLCGGLFLRKMPVIPVDLVVRSRKLSSATLIVFDRTVTRAGTECTDVELREVSAFVQRLTTSLRESGGQSVKVGVVPGSDGPLELLDTAEGLKGCDGALIRSSSRVRAVPGIRRGLPSALDLGAEINEVFVAQQQLSPTERMGLVTIVRGAPAGTGYIHPSIDVLDAVSQRHRLFLNMVHLGVNPLGNYERPSYRPSYYGVRWRELLLASRALEDPKLLAASLGHLGNDVHISG